MTRKIFRSIFAAAFASLTVGMVLFVFILYRYFGQNELQQLKSQAELAATGIEQGGETYLSGLHSRNSRLTWIAADGTVRFDSVADASSMENHAGRKEVREALADGFGESRRYSATLSEETLYAAERLADGSVVRVSATQNSVLVLIWGMLWPLSLVLAATLVLSFFLSRKLAADIVRPLNEIDLDNPLENDTYEEIAPLLRRMEEERREILSREMELGRKQAEFNTLTRNMSEGLILLNEHGRILFMNNSARRLFAVGGDPSGKPFTEIDHSLLLQELTERALNEGKSDGKTEIAGRSYRLILSAVNSGGLLILTVDETDRENAEKMRREFTANVSHELKTPLQSILGSAELIAGGLVKPSDIPAFSERIRRESARMVSLIDDIMRLSEMDEGETEPAAERLDLADIAAGAADLLAEKARANGVSVTRELGKGPVTGNAGLLAEIAMNLIDNAVKYNRKGGSVTVQTGTEADDCAFLRVSDTGVGIPAEDQKRVFERFYRVDKSRSKETGGTGLGLSIVKHAVQKSGGTVDLVSTPGQGTEVTVRFRRCS